MALSKIKTNSISDDAVTAAKIGVDVLTDQVAGITSAATPGSDALTIDSNEHVTIINDLIVDTTTLKVDSGNNRVGIGTASPDVKLEIAETASDTGVQLKLNGNRSSNGNVGDIIFENNSDSVAMIRSERVGGNNDAADLSFWTQATGGSNSERMRIDSSGSVCIGDTAANAHANVNDLIIGNTSGHHGIQIRASNSSNSAIFFGDNDSHLSGQLEYGHSTDAFYFITGGNQRARLDVHGLKFGSDSAAANALDDYEEGTFTPGATISGASGAIAFEGTNNHLNYTKIGDMVHIQGTLQIDSNSANGGRLNITGLPFTAASLDGLGGQTIFHVQISGGTGSQASGYLTSLAEGATQLQVQTYTGIGASNDSAVTMAADSFLLINGQYKAA